ncbi:MAG: Rhamnulokinase, partial [uncultured Thermomicrobiales bacterium]
RAACAESGQAPPTEPGPLVRCLFESLALKYRWVLEEIEAIAGWRAECIHVVGGGSRNAMLNALTADATGRPVLAGPVEATALGNLLTQAMARGELASLAEIRAVVRRSTDPRPFEPDPDRGAWDDAYGRFGQIMASDAERQGRT